VKRPAPDSLLSKLQSRRRRPEAVNRMFLLAIHHRLEMLFPMSQILNFVENT